MLKTRAYKRPSGEYFGTYDKMAIAVQQNLKKKKKKYNKFASNNENLPENYANLGNIYF